MRRAGSAEKLNAFFADKARAAADQASRATDNVVRTVDEALLSAEDEQLSSSVTPVEAVLTFENGEWCAGAPKG